MKELSENTILEMGLLAHLLRRCEQTITGIVGTVLRREDFEIPVHGRLFAALKLWSVEATESLPSELHDMFIFCGDTEAAEALIDLSCAPFPDSTTELISVALHIRDQANYRENCRLENDARGVWIREECERADIPIEPDDDVEW